MKQARVATADERVPDHVDRHMSSVTTDGPGGVPRNVKFAFVV